MRQWEPLDHRCRKRAEGDSAVRWVPPAAPRSVREASIRSRLRLHTFNTEGSVRTACAAHYTPRDARHLPECL